MTAANRPDWATIPNLVTLVRFVLLAPVCLLLLDGPDTLAVVLLLVWASTDWVDGMLARALDQTSRTGAIIDPIADRVGLVAIVLSLAVADLLPWAALAIILAVDVAMVALATQAALGGADLGLLARQDPHLRADELRVPAGRGRGLGALAGPCGAGAVLGRGGAAGGLRGRLHHQGAAGPRRRTGGGGTSFAAMTSARGTLTSPRRVITRTVVSSVPKIVPSASDIDSPCGADSRSIA